MARTVGNVIAELLNRYGLTQRLKEFEAVAIWPEVAGEHVAKATQAKDVRDGRLFVEVTNSIWRNELYYLKADLIEKLNKKIGQKVINDIFFS
jgi:predicted nucleic acid-binding Zn ribbon protein